MNEKKQSTAVAPIEMFRRELTAMGPQFAMVLPPHVTQERFVRVVITAMQKNADLMLCERASVFGAAMAAAQDGLLPDGREGAIVKFGNKAAWMPMVKGILKTVRNSGELSSIAAEVIYEEDKFRYWVDADGQHVEHEPALFVEDRGLILGAYAIAKTKDGDIYVEAMTKAQIEKVRSVSRAKDSGPWRDWWDEMAKKTVIRRLAKRLPSSTDLERVLERDNDLYDLNQQSSASAPAQPKTRRLDAIVGNSQGKHVANETGGSEEYASAHKDASNPPAAPPAATAEETAASAVDKL